MVETLGAAKRQMVEIARAVHHNAEVIIFDEPTAVADAGGEAALLRPDAAAQGARRVDRLHLPRARRGAADRRPHHHPARRRNRRHRRGRRSSTATRSSRPWSAARCRRELYSERDADARSGRRGKRVLSVQDISMGSMVRNNSFSIFEGQITGIFGLIGSGRTETFKIVSGIYKRDFLRGGDDRARRPAGALQRAARGGEGRHRLRHRGPQERRLLRDHVDRREFLCRASRRRTSKAPGSSSLTEMRELAADWTKQAQHQGDQRQCPRRRAFRRQPAEGRDRQGPRAEAAHHHLRRADARRRRRRHRRDPPDHQRPRRRRASPWS